MASIRSIVWAARVRHLSTLTPDEVMKRIDDAGQPGSSGFIGLPACDRNDNSPDAEYVAHVNVAHISTVLPCTDGER